MEKTDGGQDAAKCMFSFHFTAQALAGEKALRAAGFEADLIVPPPHLDEGCNLGIKIDLAHKTEIEHLLREKNIPFTAISPLQQ